MPRRKAADPLREISAMPEVSIAEDGDLLSWEDDVRHSRQSFGVGLKAQTVASEHRSEKKLTTGT
jgi:hypothetical protein